MTSDVCFQISSVAVRPPPASETSSSPPSPLRPERIMGRRTFRLCPMGWPACPISRPRTCLLWWMTCVMLCSRPTPDRCTPPDRWAGCCRSSTAGAPLLHSTPSPGVSLNTPTVGQRESSACSLQLKQDSNALKLTQSNLVCVSIFYIQLVFLKTIFTGALSE